MSALVPAPRPAAGAPAAARRGAVMPQGEPAAVFEAHRAMLWAVAYRMLGSCADAEDVVQETYLRWHQADRSAIALPQAWLITACTRLSIDLLRSARRRRERYVGPWLPEPLVGSEPAAAEERVERRESLSMAFLLLLERLGPVERAAYLLHEVFDLEHAEVAKILGKSVLATRQIVSRAKRRLPQSGRGRRVPQEQHARLAEAFFAALDSGELKAMIALLAEDAELTSDGGGKVLAARRVITGASRIARFLHGIGRKSRGALQAARASVNGGPGLVLRRHGAVFSVLSVEPDASGDRIAAVFMMRNPDKLGSLRPAGAERSGAGP